MNTSSLPWEHYTHHALIMGKKAQKISLKHFRHIIPIDNKSDQGYDPVTDVDRNIEKEWRAHITEHFPNDGILGEEYPPKQAMPHCPTWVLDPLDGTRNYVVGSLFWGHLIGLNHGGVSVLGSVNMPIIGEEFCASPRNSFWQKDGKKKTFATSTCSSLDQARMGCTTPDLFTSPYEKDLFETIKEQARLCVFGGNFYSYCLLALGHLDIVIESSLAPHDVHAIIPLVHAAGGKISDWQGNPPEKGGQILACSTEQLHQETLKKMRQ